TVDEALARAHSLAVGTHPGALLVLSERTDGETWARLLAEADEVLPWPIDDDVVIGRLEKLASRNSATLVEQASRLTRLGFWTYDEPEGECIWNDELYRIFGLPQSVSPTLATFYGAIHPEDAPILRAAAQRTRETGEPFQVRFRINAYDGKMRHVSS